MNSPERQVDSGSESVRHAQREQQVDVGESKARFIERKPAASTLFLLALAAVALYFCYLIARPFLTPIFLAVMIAIVFHPIHVRVQVRLRGRNAAALISTILVLIILVVPTIELGAIVSKEVRGLYQLLDERSAQQGGWNPFAMHIVGRLLGWVGQYFDLKSLDLRGAILRWLEQISRFLLSRGAQILSNIISFFAEAVIAFFTLFFLFREGGSITARAASFLPLRTGQLDRLFTGISNSIIANVYGCLAVGVAQGTLLCLSFWVLGLPSPVLWGLVTALFSLIPIIGSAAVWGPAVIILMVSGHLWKGLILLGWGAAVVGQVDSLVRPYVIGERAKMHTLLVFFALLGGVKAFGVMGLFVGPVVLSVTLVVLEMLREESLDRSPTCVQNEDHRAT
ncbi:MAG TPA: AI-2E family transporter [Candidatus Bathyarchaeia archaeon]|nr:AI-2E family transporter [Candidatus Bathyarchaeia archaeon]